MSICSTSRSAPWFEPESLCAKRWSVTAEGAAGGVPPTVPEPATDRDHLLVTAAFGCGKHLPGPIRTAAQFGAGSSGSPDLVVVDRLWLAAVGCAARGHYAAARADLTTAARIAARRASGPDTIVRLARVRVAFASFVRQLGDHRMAARLDGAAVVALRGVDTGAYPDVIRAASIDAVRAASIDAMAGLAADALGDGGAGRAGRLVRRLDAMDRSIGVEDPTDELSPAPSIADREIESTDLCASQTPRRGPGGRERIRAGWVRAEVAMTTGDADAAITAAGGALDRALAGGSCRHRAKSALVLAAARVAAGDPEGARPLLECSRAVAVEHGYLPLVWAAGMLAPAVGADAPEHEEVTAQLIRRGGRPYVLGGLSATR